MPPKRRNQEPEVDPLLPFYRARGALFGLAVGDAMGATTEFKALPAPSFPDLCDGPQTGLLGRGPHNVEKGQVTDDTHMAVCLAESLCTLGGYDGHDALQRYREWLPHAFDAGNLTREVLSVEGPRPIQERASLEAWLRSGRRSAGNGSLMRTAPIGVWFHEAGQQEWRIRASLADAALTHYDPRCQLAGVALNASIAAAIRGGPDVDADQMVEAAERELLIGAPILTRDHEDLMVEVAEAAELLRGDLRAARHDDPELYGPDLHLTQSNKAGFVRAAFRLAYWELFHAPNVAAALIDVTNRGGDADTNAAITGALLGARDGEEALPLEWRQTVLEALRGRPRDPFWYRYHPRLLIRLADLRMGRG
ncbi:MAG TPA: ADP-ribosylglycohydrolase family protein [Myxococcaceae bacterium]|nr:ADP-ribosylglycohydrolase family protein [Myxococcaceae bacterium]